MRNLAVLTDKQSQCNIDPAQIKNFAVDSSSGRLFIVDNELTLHIAKLVEDDTQNPVTVDIGMGTDASGADLTSPGAQCLSVEYLLDSDSACVATTTGEIVMVNTVTRQAECVGSFETGLSAISWSPDGEVVTMVTGSGSLVALTSDWEELMPEIQLCPIDQAAGLAPTIAWRGDGEYFSVEYTLPANERADPRQFTVYNRSGELTATSESVKGVMSATAFDWRPSGNYITAARELNGRQEILQFERNGLLHLNFAVKFSNKSEGGVIEAVKWNAGSDILAVQLTVPGKDGADPSSVLQLYSFSNFHWYLKQEIVTWQDASRGPKLFSWDPESANTLYMSDGVGAFRTLYVNWDAASIAHSNNREHPAVCAVIDGNEIKLTPFAIANVPPPYCSCTIKLPDNQVANAVALSPEGKIAIATSAENVLVYDVYCPTNAKETATVPARLSQFSIAGSLRQLSWYDASTVVYASADTTDAICHLNVGDAGATPARLDLPQGLVTLSCREGVCAVHLTDSTVHRYYVDQNRVDPWILALGDNDLPSECHWLDSILMEGENILVALDSRSRLYVHGKLVAQDVTSFLLYENFLLFTTLSHVLRFVRLAGAFNESLLNLPPLPTMSSGDAFEAVYNEGWRNIERGSILIVGVPSTVKIVTQMPRGNLETLAPRPLLLDRVREHLDAVKYRDAFLMMRTHRLDLNYFFDHHPKSFLEHVDDFVEQIANEEYFNLFLSNLHVKDSSQMFISPNPHPRLPSATGEAKVNMVTSTLRQALIKKDAEKYRLAILTTYVKSAPPQLEEVLSIVQAISDTEVREACVKFVAFLTDVKHLYRVALGMYDFGLVLLVAQISKMDPKEYLPFLKKLQAMEPFFQKYSIDSHLGRHGSALFNLSHAGEEYFEQCIELVKEHSLYAKSLDVFSDRPEKLKKMYILFAEYQFGNGRVSEAARLYELAEENATAIQYYVNSVSWREALSLAARVSLPEAELKSICSDLVDALRVECRYGDAAEILTTYLGKHDEAVDNFTEGAHYLRAAQLAAQHGLDKREDIKAAILDSYEMHTFDIAEKAKKHKGLVDRLVELRDEKETWARLALERGANGQIDDDAQSVNSIYSTGSAASGSSRGSGKSGKSGRSTTSRGTSRNSSKAQRNRHKKGNPLEEHYLVETIQALFPSESHQQEVRDTLQALISCGCIAEGRVLQRVYGELLANMAKHVHLCTEPLTSEDYLRPERPWRPKPVVPPVSAWAFDLLKESKF